MCDGNNKNSSTAGQFRLHKPRGFMRTFVVPASEIPVVFPATEIPDLITCFHQQKNTNQLHKKAKLRVLEYRQVILPIKRKHPHRLMSTNCSVQVVKRQAELLCNPQWGGGGIVNLKTIADKNQANQTYLHTRQKVWEGHEASGTYTACRDLHSKNGEPLKPLNFVSCCSDGSYAWLPHHPHPTKNV